MSGPSVGSGTDAAREGPAVPERGRIARPRLGANVVALAAVSFFTDASSEMIYPLLPIFLTTVLGASASAIGVIEGVAESVAALLRLASGWWSDRAGRRKPLVVAGYGIASAVRPLVAAAGTAGQVFAIRVTDRVGKGIRSSPRDALIADSVDPAVRGRAFGFHRAADHAGGVVGPLVAFALLRWGGLPIRVVFAMAAIPAALAMIVLVVKVKEPRDAGDAAPAAPAGRGAGGPPQNQNVPVAVDLQHRNSAAASELTPSTTSGRRPLPRGARLPPRFWGVLAAVVVFTLGNSTDAFLLLRATDLGVAASLVPVLWAALHVVKSVSSTPGGALSDRLGRKPLIVAGWLLYALVYLGFATAGAAWQAWALFGLYGVFSGLTEGTEKALVADLVRPDQRGRAFGWYNLALGIGALPASLIFGLLWDRAGPRLAFSVGAGFAIIATIGIAAAAPRRAEPVAPA